MKDLLMYLGIILIGYIVGKKVRPRAEYFTFTGKIQTIAIVFLVLSMGVRMGINDEVINQLNTIGLYALIITLVVMLFSLLGATFVRRAMGFDKYGYTHKDEVISESETLENVVNENNDNDDKKDYFILIIVLSVLIGLLVGRFIIFRLIKNIELADSVAGYCITIGLCLLMLFVGLDLGIEGTVVTSIRNAGWRVIVIPVTVIVSTLLGALVCGLLLPISIRETMAIGAGLGWYSLAPGIIMDNGYVVAGAVSFVHNVLRELLSIIIIPIVAKKIGYIETTALPGAAAMDVCLPIVEKSTRGDIVVFSFFSGLFLTIAVPALVPIILKIGL